MSSKKYAAPLQLDVFSSRVLLILVGFSYCAAIAVLFFIDLSVIILVGIGGALLMHGIYVVFRQAIRNNRRSIVRVIWEDTGRWYIVRKNGEKVRVQFRGESFVSPWFTVLNFKVPEKWLSESVILTTDNVNFDAHRRLRVRLKTTPQELFE